MQMQTQTQTHAISGPELSQVKELIEASRIDMAHTTGIDVAFLGDLVHNHPQLFETAYRARFPNLFTRP